MGGASHVRPARFAGSGMPTWSDRPEEDGCEPSPLRRAGVAEAPSQNRATTGILGDERSRGEVRSGIRDAISNDCGGARPPGIRAGRGKPLGERVNWRAPGQEVVNREGRVGVSGSHRTPVPTRRCGLSPSPEAPSSRDCVPYEAGGLRTPVRPGTSTDADVKP